MARLFALALLVVSLSLLLCSTKVDAAFTCGPNGGAPPRYTCACTPWQYWSQYGYWAFTPEDGRSGSFDPTCPGQGQCLGWRCFGNQWLAERIISSPENYQRGFSGNLQACAKNPYGACMIYNVNNDCPYP